MADVCPTNTALIAIRKTIPTHTFIAVISSLEREKYLTPKNRTSTAITNTENLSQLSKSMYIPTNARFCRVKAIASTAAVHVRNLPIVPQLCKFAYKSTRMMSDEQIMTLIYSLQNDPDIQNILKDPDLLNALNAGDIDTLRSNPTFMNLLQNKKIQQIKKRMNPY